MVRTLFLLPLYLTLGVNDAKAYCYASEWTWYGPVYSSLGVANGTTMESCQQLACQLYPGIPECGQPPPPPCQDIVEFQSLACQPNYSGVINQTRTKTCSDNQWTDWVTTTDNCTPNPPTCQASVQERQVACQDGFEGSITQQQTLSCPDPYGQPVAALWIETANSCVKSLTNPTNVASPISPVSPINPIMNVAPTPIVSDVPPSPVQDMTPTVTTTSGSTQSTTTETKTETKQETKTETKSETKQETSTPSSTQSSGSSQAGQAPSVPKGKELVPGFGLVMSLEILNAPIQFQQQQLEIALDYSQELPYELRGNQNILLEFITDTFVVDSWNSTINAVNRRLLRYNEVQPDY